MTGDNVTRFPFFKLIAFNAGKGLITNLGRNKTEEELLGLFFIIGQLVEKVR